MVARSLGFFLFFNIIVEFKDDFFDGSWIGLVTLSMGFLPANPANGANGASAPFSRRNDKGRWGGISFSVF